MRASTLGSLPIVALLAAAASAQSLNIDFNSANGTPAGSYGAAANKPGTWNQLPATLPLAATPLVDLAGAATGATLELAAGPNGYNGLGAYNWNNPNTTGGDEALMDDILDVGGGFSSVQSEVLVTVKGLAGGTYDVYTYAWGPDNYLPGNGGFAWNTLVTVTGATQGQITVGSLDWPGSHQPGLTYARHTVTLAAGADLEILLEADVLNTGFAALNGIQIVDQSGSTSSFCVQTKPTTVPGCSASLSAFDLTLATGTWNVSNVPLGPAAGGTSVGIFIYRNGVGLPQSTFSATTPFGVLCLNPFFRSAPSCAAVTISGGGTNVCHPGFPPFAIGCNGGALNIAVGESVNVQGWYRDPGAAGNANFTNSIYYTVQ